MKYIIILLTSLFLVGNASAEDKFKTMTDVCEYYDQRIIRLQNVIVESDVDTDFYIGLQNDLFRYSTIYKNLDCSDIAPLRKLL